MTESTSFVPLRGMPRWTQFKRLIPRSLIGFGRTWIIEGRLAHKGNDPDPLDKVRLATISDLPVLRALGMPSEVARRRLESLVQIRIGEREGEPLGCLCHDLGNCYPEPWLQIEMRPGSVFGFGALVGDAHRGRGVAGGIVRAAYRDFRAEGYSRSIGAVDFTNHSSLRLAERVGTLLLGNYRYIRILGLTFFVSPGAVRLGRFNAERPLRLTIADIEFGSAK